MENRCLSWAVYSPNIYPFSSLKLSTTIESKKNLQMKGKLYILSCFPRVVEITHANQQYSVCLLRLYFIQMYHGKSIVRKLIRKKNLIWIIYAFFSLNKIIFFFNQFNINAENMMVLSTIFHWWIWYCLYRRPTSSLLCIQIERKKIMLFVTDVYEYLIILSNIIESQRIKNISFLWYVMVKYSDVIVIHLLL